MTGEGKVTQHAQLTFEAVATWIASHSAQLVQVSLAINETSFRGLNHLERHSLIHLARTDC